MVAFQQFEIGRPLTLLVTAALLLASSAAWPRAAVDSDLRPDYRPVAYALKGARIVPVPGTNLENGTVVIRQGVIEAVGKVEDVTIPADAETIDGKGLVVYAGFIDTYTTLGASANAVKSQTGAGRSIAYGDFALPRTPPDNRNGLTPEFEVASSLDLSEATAEERRKLGFTDLIAAPGGSIAAGQSTLVSLSGLPRREAVERSPVGLHVALRPPVEIAPPRPDESPVQLRRRFQGLQVNYPTSLMGVVSHLRQAMLDAEYNRAAIDYYKKQGGPRPSYDPALLALLAAKTKKFPIWWEANTRDEIHRALDLAEEFSTNTTIVGGHEAAKVSDRLRATDTPVVLRLDFGDEPKVPTESEYQGRDDEGRNDPIRVLAHRLSRWKEQVGAATALQKAGVRFAFASDGIAKSDLFHAQVRKVIAAGLSADAAVDALTRRAAEITGMSGRLGSIEKGKLGHLVALTGPYGEEKSKIRYVFVDGFKFDMDKPGQPKKKADAKSKDEPKDDSAKSKPKTEPATSGGRTEEPPAAKGDVASGRSKSEEQNTEDAAKLDAPKGKAESAKPTQAPQFRDVVSELDENRQPSLKTGGDVLIKDALILTVSKAGAIAKGSILVRGGRIVAVGPDIDAPNGVTVINALGLVAMPGIIDTHSHMAIAGGVNEMSLSIVPEVRVRDVVDGDDPTIYRALAGGVTSARLLHGSANTIGGQDVVIKLKHGLAGRDLILRDDKRPQGVKFALGENVTRRTGRFPNTRMGVEATIERAFDEARAYSKQRAASLAGARDPGQSPPFRRDLRLEAIAGILDDSIKIHSHCYRSDEILMLLRVAERYGVRVQSLQHVLEGYKVAAEIAAHGASASTFSDWWAYKIEAFDAIPYNAALLTEAGARVCIKSDSDELVRHLYLEAAKMVRYGGVPESTALEMITLNPAREIGLDHRLGSIEVGKDADIALFNAHPFDSFARCELALIDGEVRFQRREADAKFAPRPGNHTMPLASPEMRARTVDIPPNRQGVYALTGALLHPVSGPDVLNGTIIVAGGKIASIGGADTPIPEFAQTIDVKGLDIWPGMIDAGSIVGLFEVGSLAETQDVSDSAQFQPELRTSTALHPDSELIPVTRANGVLSAFVQPGGGTIAGQGCLVDLNGWVPSDMVVTDRIALNVNIPAYVTPNPVSSRRPETPATDPNQRRRERIEAIKDQFRLAIEYDRVVTASKANAALAPVPDPRLAALAPYTKGEKPVVFRADQRMEILDAITLAKELKLKAIISGGLEAWKVADALKAANIPVLIAGTLRLPTQGTDPYDAVYANPARLYEAGVVFAIRPGGQGPDQATAARNLPFEAAVAVAYGLPEAEAIKAVTLAPARILGVDGQIGSLEVGKRANLVITAGPLLQVTSEVKYLFIGGKPVSTESRHTRLYAKYRQRLAEIRSGAAQLGLDRPPGALQTGSNSPAAPAPANRR